MTLLNCPHCHVQFMVANYMGDVIHQCNSGIKALDEEDKLIIEVFYSWFKIRNFGSVKEYMESQKEHYAKYGYKVIFINEKEILNRDWEKICLNKIEHLGGR